MRDFLVGPLAAPCNGNIADGRIKWKYPFGTIRYFSVQGVLIGPSMAPFNGNIADGQLKWRCPIEKLRNSRNLRKVGPRLFGFRLLVAKLGELIAERHHYCREFQSINDFIL